MKITRFTPDNAHTDWSYVLAFVAVFIATFFFACVWVKLV